MKPQNSGSDDSQKMISRILRFAVARGFSYSSDAEGNWQITPSQQGAKWKLKLVEDRWLLFVNNIPQISFHHPEVASFLERRQQSSQS